MGFVSFSNFLRSATITIPRLSGRQKDKLTPTAQGKYDHLRAQTPPKAKSTLFILWKDAHTNGVKGVVELHVSDLLLTLKSARVKDLFPVLNKKINDQYQVDSYCRQVESFLLYGTRVSRDRRLDPLIPDLSLTPRFVAVMRAFPKRMPRTNISVTIKTLANTNLVLHCESSDTVGNVKAKIKTKLKTSQELQTLIYAGKQLEDHLALSTYGITDMSQIHLVRKMNGGGTCRVFADISDNSLLKEYQLYYGGAERLTVLKGLNIEGRCVNRQCSAFLRWVICPKGFQTFNLMRDEDTKCPMCRSMVIPRTCGFWECAWKFDGVQADDGYSIISQWKDARGDMKYHRFDADKYRGSVKWKSLLIVVKPLDERVSGADPCGICWSGLGSPECFVTTTCGHSFHCSCFDEWSKRSVLFGNLASCPICRGDLATKST